MLNNYKLKIQQLLTLLQSLYIPKSWIDAVNISKKTLNISGLLIKITFIPILVLSVISYLSNFIIETPFGYICIGLIYFYFISIFHLGLWIVIPSAGIILLHKILNR